MKIFLVHSLKPEEDNSRGLKESFQDKIEMYMILLRLGIKRNSEKVGEDDISKSIGRNLWNPM